MLLKFVYVFHGHFYVLHGHNFRNISRVHMLVLWVEMCPKFKRRHTFFHGHFLRFFHGKLRFFTGGESQIYTGGNLLFFTGKKHCEENY